MNTSPSPNSTSDATVPSPTRRPAATLAEILGFNPLKNPGLSASGAKKWESHRLDLLKLRQQVADGMAQMQQTAENTEFRGGETDPTADTFSDEHRRNLERRGGQEVLLSEIDAALDRIRSGSYGVCERTGKIIPPARLREVPYARCCVDIQRKRERAVLSGVGLAFA